MREYFFDTAEVEKSDKFLVLIIYDIIDNKRRNKMAHYLESFGFRVQKSAFEAILNKKLYEKLLKEIKDYMDTDDNIRVYKINGYGEIKTFGNSMSIQEEETIIV